MRAVVAAAVTVLVALVAVLAVALGSRAQPVPTRVESSYTVAEPVCSVTDERLAEISGMAVLDGDLWVVDDQTSALYRLDGGCRVAEVVDLAPRLDERKVTLRDVEDLVAGVDGWLWLADTGGNRVDGRHTVQVAGYNPATDRVKSLRLEYPSGTYDVEAMLVGLDGRAVLVTKDADGPATVFSTPDPLLDDTTQALVREGTVALGGENATTPERLVTGGAVSGSGVHVALRTYAAAWEYDVPDGDIARALVTATPRPVPLPKSRQGEALTYAAAGTAFLATTEGLPAAVDRVDIVRARVEVP